MKLKKAVITVKLMSIRQLFIQKEKKGSDLGILQAALTSVPILAEDITSSFVSWREGLKTYLLFWLMSIISSKPRLRLNLGFASESSELLLTSTSNIHTSPCVIGEPDWSGPRNPDF